eukprot:SAG31_NODE_3864_length_3803_cov_1.622300_2_plen_159_part_01
MLPGYPAYWPLPPLPLPPPPLPLPPSGPSSPAPPRSRSKARGAAKRIYADLRCRAPDCLRAVRRHRLRTGRNRRSIGGPQLPHLPNPHRPAIPPATPWLTSAPTTLRQGQVLSPLLAREKVAAAKMLLDRLDVNGDGKLDTDELAKLTADDVNGAQIKA